MSSIFNFPVVSDMEKRSKMPVLCMLFICAVAIRIPMLSGAEGDMPAIPEAPNNEKNCSARYTVHENVLKLTAQFYPLEDEELFGISNGFRPICFFSGITSSHEKSGRELRVELD